jgi:Protein of unknown function (DUF4229)
MSRPPDHAEPTPAAPAAGPGAGRMFALYTLGRFAVFVVLTALLFGLGAAVVALTGHRLDGRSAQPLVLAAAFVAAPLSMLVSYVVLARQRVVLTSAVAGWVEGFRARAAARTAAEDAYADRLAATGRAADGTPPTAG